MKKEKQNLFAGIFLLVFICAALFSVSVHAQNLQAPSAVGTFDELKTWLQENQSVGGTVALTQDIMVPAGETFEYANGRYRKEVTIQTQGHTIYVEGSVDLWPFLTIVGDGSQNEIFHVSPGGELRLVSISLDAGEGGIAIVQEEGSFLIYASEEGMGLPAFSCIGQIVSPQTVTAAAEWQYNLAKLPVVRIPAGETFSEDLLPETVLAKVNRDYGEEEEVPVIWDSETFPTQESRAIISGKFAEGYAAFDRAVPKCLVVWESVSEPFFLNVYLEHITPWYDLVYMYGETPQAGEVRIEASDDGETWEEITQTEGYEPIVAEENENLVWMLSYPKLDSAVECPRYYRMMQMQADGTPVYSDAVTLTDDLIFTGADIEGGRGGETSPNEGSNQLPEEEVPMPESQQNVSDESSEPSTATEVWGSEASVPEKSTQQSQPEIESYSGNDEKNPEALEEPLSSQSEEYEPQTDTSVSFDSEQVDSDSEFVRSEWQIAIGICLIIAIMTVSVGSSIYLRRNRNQ